MKKGRFLVRWAGIVAVLMAFSMYAIEAVGVVETPAAGDEPRADILVIDSLQAFGELEEAPVTFLHDQHTKALAEAGDSDCKTCHKSDKDQLSPKFKRLEDADAGTVKEIYHSGCIGCHQEMADKGQESGPTEASCRSCHSKETAASSWKPIRMDKSLHWRHVDSKAIPKGEDDRTCQACHHVYDEQAEKTVYAKGKEEMCAACHGEEPKKDVKSFRQAAHAQCVNCHVDVAAAKVDSGPVTCAGCHAEAEQAKIKVVQDVPRLKREQPDVVLLTVSDEAALAKDKKGYMSPVAFNHKAHEEFNDTCRACHHTKIESCATECHTLAGSEKGGYVTLEQAMHSVSAQSSCIGCHNERKTAKECAGCHNLMPQSRVSEKTCASCHDDTLQLQNAEALKKLSKEERTAMAAVSVESRETAGTYDMNEIPEKVVIADLVDKYEPAEFPHRKIVDTMFKKVGESEMAAAFHSEKGTFCQGCHHNSPASKTPPRCASCHAKPFTGKDHRPGLKAAFHQQCIGCHQAMELEKPAATACADCHKERKK